MRRYLKIRENWKYFRESVEKNSDETRYERLKPNQTKKKIENYQESDEGDENRKGVEKCVAEVARSPPPSAPPSPR